MSARARYNVYVIELKREVRQREKFRNANPKMHFRGDCVYVGSTVRKPELRFEQHKEGYKSNTYVQKFGERLRPDLYEQYNPIPSRVEAEELESYLAERLRSKGYGVWQG